VIKFSKEETNGKEDIQNMSSDQKTIWLVKVWKVGDCDLQKNFFVSCTHERMKRFRVPKGSRATYEKANTKSTEEKKNILGTMV